MTKSHPQIGFHPAPIHTNIKLASIMLTLFLFPFLCHVTMPEEEYTPGKYSIIPLMVPHSILIHTCFYVFIKDIISEKLQCDNPSAENSKSSANFSIQLLPLLECMQYTVLTQRCKKWEGKHGSHACAFPQLATVPVF